MNVRLFLPSSTIAWITGSIKCRLMRLLFQLYGVKQLADAPVGRLPVTERFISIYIHLHSELYSHGWQQLVACFPILFYSIRSCRKLASLWLRPSSVFRVKVLNYAAVWKWDFWDVFFLLWCFLLWKFCASTTETKPIGGYLGAY